MAVAVATPISIYVYYVINSVLGCGFLGYVLAIPIVMGGGYILSQIAIRRCMSIKTTELLCHE